jgi:S-(hydroxymethyl)glutathione dehydrogenase/alcohol dehydrogenase
LRAAVVGAVGQGFTTVEVDIARPVGREVLVAVRASGLCHTDHTIATRDMGIPMPVVAGHEVSGIVADVGTEVTRFAVGDRVVAWLIQACGACPRCLGGRPYQCVSAERLGRSPSQAPRLSRGGEALFQAFGLGGFAEQALIHENQLVGMPDWMPFAQAALLGCGVVTGAGAVLNTAAVAAGDTVVVLGAGGGVGLNAISGARLAGASRIVAVDLHKEKLDKSAAFGATDVVNAADADPVLSIHELLPGGADHVFDFVGTDAVAAQGMAMLGVGGAFYVIGVSGPTSAVSVNLVTAVMRQIRVIGVNTGSTNPLRDIPMYMELYRQGRLNLDDLVSREISLDEIEDAYATLGDPTISRIVITSFG